MGTQPTTPPPLLTSSTAACLCRPSATASLFFTNSIQAARLREKTCTTSRSTVTAPPPTHLRPRWLLHLHLLPPIHANFFLRMWNSAIGNTFQRSAIDTSLDSSSTSNARPLARQKGILLLLWFSIIWDLKQVKNSHYRMLPEFGILQCCNCLL